MEGTSTRGAGGEWDKEEWPEAGSTEAIRQEVSIERNEGRSINRKPLIWIKSSDTMTKHSQSYYYCDNQEPEMKNRDSREKLTKALA